MNLPAGTPGEAASAQPAPTTAIDTPTDQPTTEASEGVAHPRAIRSFVIRAGRLTTGQAKAIADFGPQYLLTYAPETGFIERLLAEAKAQGQVYERVVMEIGFGMGAATAHIAALQPGTLFLCCEVHEPGVGALLKLVGEQGLTNIRILQHDAVEVIDHMLPEGSLDGVHIFFPDPWHKKKHNKRRLIQPALVARLASRLAPGGYLHCATDWQPYAEQMLQVLSAEPLLTNTVPDYAPQPAYRPLTKFENRGLKLGHGVWDLIFLRRA